MTHARVILSNWLWPIINRSLTRLHYICPLAYSLIASFFLRLADSSMLTIGRLGWLAPSLWPSAGFVDRLLSSNRPSTLVPLRLARHVAPLHHILWHVPKNGVYKVMLGQDIFTHVFMLQIKIYNVEAVLSSTKKALQKKSLDVPSAPSVSVLDRQPTKGCTRSRWMWPRRDR
jgi:hypothetical protein